MNDLILLSRLIDLGAVIVALTSIIVTTKNSIKTLEEKITDLTIGVNQQRNELLKSIEMLSSTANRHEIELTRIKERCTLLTARGESCS